MKGLAILLLCAAAGAGMAAEIKVLSAGAIEPGLKAAAAAFRKQTGQDVNITFNTAPQIRKRIAGGEAFDVVIAPPAALDEFAAAGKIAADRVRRAAAPEVQNYTSFSAVPMTAAANAGLAGVFVRYLGGPEGRAQFTAAGVE